MKIPANIKIGVIGFGNIGKALVKGLLLADPAIKENIIIYLRPNEDRKKMKEGVWGKVTDNITDFITQSEIIFLCVKSTQLKDLIRAITASMDKRKKKILVSMCSGVPLAVLEQFKFENIVYVKAIANINIQSGAGLSIVYSNWDAAKKSVLHYLKKLGVVIEARTEDECDRLSNFAATLPAFIATSLSALIDAGLYIGITKELSIFIATQVMKGTAETLRQLKLHPEEYRQQITSPGGVVIKGVRVLERHKLRSAFIEAFSVIEETIAEKKP